MEELREGRNVDLFQRSNSKRSFQTKRANASEETKFQFQLIEKILEIEAENSIV